MKSEQNPYQYAFSSFYQQLRKRKLNEDNENYQKFMNKKINESVTANYKETDEINPTSERNSGDDPERRFIETVFD